MIWFLFPSFSWITGSRRKKIWWLWQTDKIEIGILHKNTKISRYKIPKHTNVIKCKSFIHWYLLVIVVQPAREARRLLHRNGNFVPLAPWIRTHRWVKTGFWQKTGPGRAVYESIRKVPTGKTTEISVASQPSIRFFPLMARNGPFRPFFGP